ncbi:hypothetical protein ACETK8_20540 (plasmid) [Brevundimonas staleyi]|uniref:Uncharacterized protein n=1 Tax=Brevundimonas staleyi TaxID=74326 RepID=A0ABW0FPU5_9CAUL
MSAAVVPAALHLLLFPQAAPPSGGAEGPLTGDALPVPVALDNAFWFRAGVDYLAVEDPSHAEGTAQAVALARTCFDRRFGVAPLAGAVMATGLAGLFEELPLERQGWVLPWRFNRSEPETPEAHASSLRHELGHTFLLNTLLPNLRKGQYGGDAPDWLDEAAGVAMESTASRDDRRRRFGALVADGRLTPFTRFVVQAHPVFASQRLQTEIARARAAASNQAIVLEFTLSELGVTGSSPDDFYAQTGAVIDFLDTLGDAGLLGRISRDIADSGEAAGWLERLGPDVGLPRPDDWDEAFAAWSTRAPPTATAGRDCDGEPETGEA